MKQLTFFDVIPDFEPNHISESTIEKIIMTGSNRTHSMESIATRLISGYKNLPSFLKREFGTGSKGLIIDGKKILYGLIKEASGFLQILLRMNQSIFGHGKL